MKPAQKQTQPKRRRFLPLLAALCLLLSGTVAFNVTVAKPAAADTGDYPNADAATVKQASYEWGYTTCVRGCSAWYDYLNGVKYYILSSRGYVYRNCTDYVSWKLESLGVSASLAEGRGNGGQWDSSLPAGVTSTSVPEVGDAAVIHSVYPGDTFGHVAFVEAVQIVSGAYQVQVSQYNWNLDGNYTLTGWQKASTYSNFVDFNGVGTPLGGSSPPSAPPDADGDGVPDSLDAAPNTPGPVANRGIPDYSSRVTGDFNGDGKQDIAYFYDYLNGETMLSVFTGNGNGTFTPQTTPVWDSAGQASWGRMKVVTGDFNGDGYSDIALFYGYSGNETKLSVFYGSASGLTAPVLVWDSNGTLNWDVAKVVAGDFNGDGKADIALFYGYAGAETVLYEFYGSSGGPTAPSLVWDSGAGNYDWNFIKPVVGDFNGDGKQDIAVFYGRPGTRTWITEFQGATTGFTAIPYIVWDSGVGGMDWNMITPVAGNFSGNTRSDIAVFYGFLGQRTKLYEFAGPSGTMFSNPNLVWDSGAGNYDWNVTKSVAGDFNEDGKTDIAVFYSLPSSRVVIDEFQGAATGFTVLSSAVWDSGPDSLDWSNMLVG